MLGTGVTCITNMTAVQNYFDLQYPDETNLNLQHYAISFSWFETFIKSDPDQLQANPTTLDKGSDAYHLTPIYKSISQFIANTNEQKIVHINYEQNEFNKIDLSGGYESQKFGKLSQGETDTLKRTLITQPYLTFRLRIDNHQVFITATQKGESHVTIILGVWSMIGGLLALFSSTIKPFINKVTVNSYLRHATHKLYLLRKDQNQPKTSSKVSP